MFKKSDFKQYSNYFLSNEAESRGYEVEKLYPDTKKSHLKITNKKGEIAVIIGQRLPSLSFSAQFICKKKDLTKNLLKMNKINVSEGRVFEKDDYQDAVKYFNEVKKPVVVKPVEGTWGSNVFLNINSLSEFEKATNSIFENKSRFLIEEQSSGKEFRILATKNELLGIIHRIPANIIGDGCSTVEELINKKNNDPRRGESHESSLVKIKVDDEVLRNLKNQSLTLESVINKDSRVFLRSNSNISTGGDSIDYTDIAHPMIEKLAKEVINSIPGLPYAGFDFLTEDISKNPYETGYTVIEINDSPMISMHQEPYEGTKRNVAKKIIDLLF